MTCHVGNPGLLLDNDSNAGLSLVNYFLHVTCHAMTSSKNTKNMVEMLTLYYWWALFLQHILNIFYFEDLTLLILMVFLFLYDYQEPKVEFSFLRFLLSKLEKYKCNPESGRTKTFKK